MTDGEEVAVADAEDRAVPPAPGRMPIGSNGAVETGAGVALDEAAELVLRGATRLAKSAFGAAEAGAAIAIKLAASGQRIRSAAEAGRQVDAQTTCNTKSALKDIRFPKINWKTMQRWSHHCKQENVQFAPVKGIATEGRATAPLLAPGTSRGVAHTHW